MKSVSDAIRDARHRLQERGLPTDPDARWTGIDYSGDIDAQVRARTDQTTDQLYNVITYGCRALVARADGDWEAYTAALWTMFGAEISGNLAEITAKLHKEHQSEQGRKPRNEAKQHAQRLFMAGDPGMAAKELLQLMIESGQTDIPPVKTLGNWLAEFRNQNKKSR